MNNEEILTGNKLIAEFMGAKNDISDIYYLPEFAHYFNSYGQIEWSDCFRLNELKYYTSWDWLMPVVEKIEASGFDVNIKGITCSINRICEDETIIQFVLGDRTRKIELVWSVVLEFIKWYNEQPK